MIVWLGSAFAILSVEEAILVLVIGTIWVSCQVVISISLQGVALWVFPFLLEIASAIFCLCLVDGGSKG